MIDPIRGSRRSALAVLAVLLVAAATACAAPVAGKPAAGHALPPLPGCAAPAHLRAPPSADELTGPAVDSLSGAAARSTFSLDGGALTIGRPGAGPRPTVSAETATCAALASNETNNGAFSDDARMAGMVYGYARVTLRDSVLASASPGAPPAPIPPSRAYHSRLAWVVVVKHQILMNCPAMPATTRPASPRPLPNYYAYELFLLDAKTGADALAYTEGGFIGCAGTVAHDPYVVMPTDTASVPWRLVSRASDGYTATIAAQVLPCDRVDAPILPDEYPPDLVDVLVQRPIGPPCGAPVERMFALHAATVTSNLPATLRHAPTGLYISVPEPSVPPPGAAPRGIEREVDYSDCGKTIVVTVGTALDLPPLPGLEPAARYPVTSSAPKVVGLLDGGGIGPVAVLRAWKPGLAEITIDPMPADMRDMVAGCAKPWVLRVAVR